MQRFLLLFAVTALLGLAACGEDEAATTPEQQVEQATEEYIGAVEEALEDAETEADEAYHDMVTEEVNEETENQQ